MSTTAAIPPPPTLLSALPTTASSSPAAFPPLTFTCRGCERILTDSSRLLFAHGSSSTLTFSGVHTTPSSTLHLSAASSWDAGCTYHALACPRCGAALGKHYYATPPGLAEFAGGYTVEIDKICVYTHGGWEPAAAVVKRDEVLRLLHPDPEVVAKDLAGVKSVCVGLMENVVELARAVREVAAGLGVQVGGEIKRLAGECGEVSGESVLEKLQTLSQEVLALKEELGGESVAEKLQSLQKDVAALKEARRKEVDGETGRDVDNLKSEERRQGKKRKLDDTSVPFITISSSPSSPAAAATAAAAAVIPDSQPTDGQLSSQDDPKPQRGRKKVSQLPAEDSSEVVKNLPKTAANEEEAGRGKRLTSEVAVEIEKAQKKEPEGRKTRTGRKRRG